MERNDQKPPQFRSPAERAGGAVISRDMPLPSLLGAGYGTYQVRPENFALSILAHIFLVALLFLVAYLAGIVGPKVAAATQHDVIMVGPPPELYHIGKGGQNPGRGGDARKLQASKRTPAHAPRTQIVPPQASP